MNKARIDALTAIIKHISPLSDKKVKWYKAEEKKVFTLNDYKIIYSCQVTPKVHTDFGSFIIRVDTETNTLSLYFGDNSIIFGNGEREMETTLIKKLIKELHEYMEQERLKNEENLLEDIKATFS